MTMIWAAFTSEWTKLKRKTLFLSTFLGLAAAASLFVVLMFSQATNNGGIVTLHQLARPNGLVIGVARASELLGVVAFGIAASQLASEYSLGTLRQLLVRQPRRAVLLAGKMLGVITFLVAALCFAAVIALIVAVLAAQSRGVSTHAWFTSAGLTDMFQELGDLAVLLHARMSPVRALWFNAASSLTSIIGGLAGFFALRRTLDVLPYAISVAAASLIYVAVADLIPGLHRRVDLSAAAAQVLLIACGVGVIVCAELWLA